MKKLMIVSLVAAGLTLAACGKKEEAVEANATELNEAVATEGTANDTMTNVDLQLATPLKPRTLSNR